MTAYADLPAATAAKGDATPVLAWNLEGVSNYAVSMPFLDIAKMMRPWSATGPGGAKLSYQDIKTSGDLDADGWPTSLPHGMTSISTAWGWAGQPEAAAVRAGLYVVTYEGEGEIRVGAGATLVSSEPGRLIFESSGDRNMTLSIIETDPEGTGDYIRDISVVREDHVELVEAGAIFNPDFIALIQDAGQLRFMDWAGLNNNGPTVTAWADRPEPSSATWAGVGGVPVEVLVRLANETGADPWFCMPHDAGEDYIREFAVYVRDNLDPRLTATVEFSNENWNFAYKHTTDLRDMAVADWGIAPNDGAGIIQYRVKLATETAMIWDEVFDEAAGPGLVKVLATQATNLGISRAMLDPTAWFDHEPDTAVNPGDVFDALAVTTYFGNATTGNAAMRAELLAVIADPETDARQWLHDKLLDPSYSRSVPEVLALLAEQKALAEATGLALVAYEGGQHVHQRVNSDDGTLDAFMRDFVRSEHMADLYQHLFDGWAEIGDGPFMQYTAVGAVSKYGSFGMRASLDDVNPRAELLDRLGAETDPWWDGAEANDAYLHGVTRTGDADGIATDDVLVGTVEEDFLIGRAGDDILIGGAGDDGLNGGTGDDVAVFSGRASDYVIEAEGQGWRITGPDGSDHLANIEHLLFEDGTVMTPEALRDAPRAAPSVPDVVVAPDAPDAPVSPAVISGQKVLVEVESVAICHLTSENGIRLEAVNRWSALGRELTASGATPETAYLASEKGFHAEIRGVSVAATYLAMEENRGADGAALSDAALQTARLLAAVIEGAAEIHGSDCGDVLLGRGADDRFFGEGGNDWLNGRAGDDRLEGGLGADQLTGGTGADVFVFAAGDGRDLIHDFSVDAGDQLELHGFGGGELADIAGLDDRGRLVLDFGADAIVLEGLGLDDVAGLQADWLAAA